MAAPVPAGMRRPTITFSLRPSSLSTLPLTAASVRTRVVSWNDAAEMNERVCKARLGDAEQHGRAARRLAAVARPASVGLVHLDQVDLFACQEVVSPPSVISIFCII